MSAWLLVDQIMHIHGDRSTVYNSHPFEEELNLYQKASHAQGFIES